MNRLNDQIRTISQRTGYSEAEIAECLAEQLDRLLGESDMAWKGRSVSDVVEDSKRQRKKVMGAIHVCSTNVKELTEIARERLHLMQSAALTVGRRLGIPTNLSGDSILQEEFRLDGILQFNARKELDLTMEDLYRADPRAALHILLGVLNEGSRIASKQVYAGIRRPCHSSY